MFLKNREWNAAVGEEIVNTGVIKLNPSRERIEACNFQPCQSTALVCTHNNHPSLGQSQGTI